jgi:protein phosphatase
MGSRAVGVLARDAGAARSRFGVEDGKTGVVYTRTGRPFFNDEALERALIERVGRAVDAIGLWERLETDWVCLDAELMPWSAKAQALIDVQYRPVGEAGIAGTDAAAPLLAEAMARGVDVGDLSTRIATRLENALAYDASWRRYVRPVPDWRIYASRRST